MACWGNHHQPPFNCFTCAPAPVACQSQHAQTAMSLPTMQSIGQSPAHATDKVTTAHRHNLTPVRNSQNQDSSRKCNTGTGALLLTRLIRSGSHHAPHRQSCSQAHLLRAQPGATNPRAQKTQQADERQNTHDRQACMMPRHAKSKQIFADASKRCQPPCSLLTIMHLPPPQQACKTSAAVATARFAPKRKQATHYGSQFS